jgi:conjugal transfer pilus assembly protein TraV
MTRIPFPLTVAALALAAALSGCASTDSSDRALSEVSSTDAEAIKGTRVVSSGSVRPPAAGAVPLRSPARVMRIWIAPWEDSRGDLHAPGYLYTEIDPRRWTLDDRDDQAPVIRPLQIERRAVPSRTARSGRGTDAKHRPGRSKAPETGPNLLGS